MTGRITITTFEWVPEFARGFVRDMRIRWLCEEIGRPYAVDTVSAVDKTPEHYTRQPFGQVPMLQDGDLSLFESGAILLHLAEGSALLPGGDDRARTQQWLIAGLNSVEPFVMQWAGAKFFDRDETLATRYAQPLRDRLARLQAALEGRNWLVGKSFTIADLLMSDLLRVPAANGVLDGTPHLAAYLERATSRPAFTRALADHMAHWQTAGEKTTASSG